MKRSNRLVILVGVLLAVLAFVAIVILLNQRPATSDGGPEEPTTVTVLVATEDIDLAEAVTPDKVTTEEVDPEAVIGTGLSSASQLQGQPALIAVPAGAQVSGEVVGIGGGDVVNIAAMLNPGEKAIAVRVDSQTGVGFLVTPGNVIDIIVSEEVTVLQPTADSLANPDGPQRFEEVVGAEAARTVKAVLQNKRVLYVSDTRAEAPEPTDTNGDGVIDENDTQPEQVAIESVVIVFAGTDADAEVIKFAQRDGSELSSERTEIPGSITVVIRHTDDDAIEETEGVTIDSLVEEFGLRIPGIVEQLNEEQPAP